MLTKETLTALMQCFVHLKNEAAPNHAKLEASMWLMRAVANTGKTPNTREQHRSELLNKYDRDVAFSRLEVRDYETTRSLVIKLFDCELFG